MLIIIGIDSHVALPGLKSVAMASRIRRLLEPFRGHHEPSPTWRSRLTLCAGIAGSALVLEGIHTVIETAIHTLP